MIFYSKVFFRFLEFFKFNNLFYFYMFVKYIIILMEVFFGFLREFFIFRIFFFLNVLFGYFIGIFINFGSNDFWFKFIDDSFF